MNDRIKQLAEQCYEHDQSWTGVGQRIFNKEKFAELIVRECCDIVLAPHNETGFTISMDLCKFSTRQAIDRAAQSGGLKVHTQGISKKIKQHFGVEE